MFTFKMMSNFIIAQNKDLLKMTLILNSTKFTEFFIDCDDFCKNYTII